MLPIHMTALNGHADCLRKLLANTPGFDMDAFDRLGRTCLHAAACGGNVDLVDLLLAAGADFNQVDNEGRTPLHFAAVNSHYDCVLSLVAAGSSAAVEDAGGRTPLHYAAAYDADARITEHLLRNDANPTSRDTCGYTPVHYAALNGHKLALEMVRCSAFPGFMVALLSSLCSPCSCSIRLPRI